MLVKCLGEVAGRKSRRLDLLVVGNFLQEQASEPQTEAIRAEGKGELGCASGLASGLGGENQPIRRGMRGPQVKKKRHIKKGS